MGSKPKYRKVAENIQRGYKKGRTRTEIAKLNKTSRTTVYRATKYLERKGKFVEPRQPIKGKPEPYKFYKEDRYRRKDNSVWVRKWFSTPTRASHEILVKKTKPDIIMLQGWCRVRIYKEGKLIHEGIHFGTSVARRREVFNYSRAKKEMLNGALADVRVRMTDTKAYTIIVEPMPPRGNKPGIRTVAYYK